MNVDVVVVGAGPVGLACAIEVQRTGQSVVVVEKGALVNSLIGYPTNMEFFSTPDLMEIGGHPFPTFGYKPVREEAIDYYRGVAHAEELDLLLYEPVTSLEGAEGAFDVHTERRTIHARQVILSTGFFDVPNRLEVPGEDLPKVHHYYREPFPFTGTDVIVVGAGNSAAKAALQCHRHGARVTMVVRTPDIKSTVKYWIRPDLENRINEGSIRALFNARVACIEPDRVIVDAPGDTIQIPNDFVLALIGYRPDFTLLEQLGCTFADDEARTPEHDPDTFETPRKGLFLAGTVCGGLQTSRWFIENGREHACVIARDIASRSGNGA